MCNQYFIDVCLIQDGENTLVLHIGKGLIWLLSDVAELMWYGLNILGHRRYFDIKVAKGDAVELSKKNFVRTNVHDICWIISRASWPGTTYWTLGNWKSSGAKPFRALFHSRRMDLVFGTKTFTLYGGT